MHLENANNKTHFDPEVGLAKEKPQRASCAAFFLFLYERLAEPLAEVDIHEELVPVDAMVGLWI